MFHKVDPKDLKPCWHMRSLVCAWLDGALTGVARWYTEWHVSQCAQCQASLPFLRSLHERLQTLAQRDDNLALPPERWSHVEAEWEKIDHSQEINTEK